MMSNPNQVPAMPIVTRSLKQLFLEALAVPAPERASWLAREGPQDTDVRQQLELMLAAHDAPQSLLDGAAPLVASPPLMTERYAAESIPPGTMIGPYKLLQQIGEGGMGVVYMAEQSAPVERRVALKIIKPGMDTRQVIARFEAERQALAMMDHPNIAKVFDAGTTDSGRPYFVMELVRGIPITKYCDEHQLTLKQRLELFLPVCQAVQHAHQKGIIHRDLKPTNVLVAQYDDKPVPKVIDFGVAKAAQKLTDRTMFTEFGQVVGTLEYMSPEQARLNQLDIDTRSDIYSLGVLLYELLTGCTPFDGKRLRSAAFDEMLRIIREEEPPKPSTRLTGAQTLPSIAASRSVEPARLGRSLRGELDWIVMKALEKDRNRRYETANGFAQDVQRYLAGEAVQAVPPSSWYRFRKFTRRYKRALATAAVLALALIAGTMVSTWQAIRAIQAEGLAATRLVLERKARKEADNARQQSDQARRNEEIAHEQTVRLADENWQQVYAARINLVQQYYEQGDVSNAISLLEGLRPEGNRADLRGFEWHYLWRLCHGEHLTFPARDGPVLSVAYSPDGQYLATGSQKGCIKLWDSKTADVLADLVEAGDEIRAIAFSPDGMLLAAASGSPGKAGSIQLWDTASRTKLRKLEGFTKPVLSIAFSPDGVTLATGTGQYSSQAPTPLGRLFWIEPGPQTGEVQLWEVSTGRERTVLPGETNGILSLTFSPDGQTLAAAGWDATVRLWNLTDPDTQTTLTGHTSYVLSVAFSPDGNTLASASGKWDGQPEVRLWDLPTGRERSLLRGHASGVTALAFSPDGQSLATSSWDRTVRLWDVTTAEERRVLRGHTNYVAAVAFSPDGEFLATGSWDGTARLWDTRSSRDHTSLGTDDLVHCYSLSFSPDDKLLAASGSGSVAVFDLATGEPRVVLPGQPSQSLVAFAPDGKSLAVAGIAHPKGNVRIYDTKDWQLRFAADASTSTVWTLAFSANSRLLATSGKDVTIRLWDVETGGHRVLYRNESAPGRWVNIRTLAISPDGKLLAACCPGGTRGFEVIAWNLETGEIQFRLDTGGCECIAFSPDGRILAASVWPNPRGVQLWDLETRQLRTTLTGHAEVVYHVAFSPDSRTLATGSWDSTVRLWQVATAQPLVTLKGHRGAVYCVAFSRDGKTLASSSQYRQAPRDALASDRLLWHAATEEGTQQSEVRHNGRGTTCK